MAFTVDSRFDFIFQQFSRWFNRSSISFHCNRGFSIIFSAIDFTSSVFTFRLLNIQELVRISHEIEKFLLITVEGLSFTCIYRTVPVSTE
jgi:hypothetical protein